MSVKEEIGSALSVHSSDVELDSMMVEEDREGVMGVIERVESETHLVSGL
jgi:hypothetical protein